KSNAKDFLGTFPDPMNVTQNDLKEYLITLKKKGLKNRSLKALFSGVNAFYDFMIYESLTNSNPIPSFRKRYLNQKEIDSENRQIICVEDVRRIISKCDHILDETLLMIVSKTGMRRGELFDLCIDDFNFNDSIITIPSKAKRTNRTVFMDVELSTVLKEYMVYRMKHVKDPKRNNWFFVTNRGGRLHRDYINRLLAFHVISLNLHIPNGPLNKRLTTHCFRHFFVTYLFQAGLNIQYIKWLRGDSFGSRESWEIYNHIDLNTAKDEYFKYAPTLLSENRKPKVRIYSSDEKKCLSNTAKAMRPGNKIKFNNKSPVVVGSSILSINQGMHDRVRKACPDCNSLRVSARRMTKDYVCSGCGWVGVNPIFIKAQGTFSRIMNVKNIHDE
ncbi:MAG: site-specific integrase, partial [Candidatus Heimdallarchaeota archaeon]|nr:site-specific integrase [Candidatus Heimdallarchaeota archaeon]